MKIETTIEILTEPDDSAGTTLHPVDNAIGVIVKVIVHNWTTGNSKTYQSSGVWGIEGDVDRQYLFQVAREQLAELQAEYPELADVTMGHPCKLRGVITA